MKQTMLSRLSVSFLILLAVGTVSVEAADDDPKSVVAGFFEALATGDNIAAYVVDPDDPGLELEMMRRLSNARVVDATSEGDTARVAITGEAKGRVGAVRAHLVRHDGEWRIEEIPASSVAVIEPDAAGDFSVSGSETFAPELTFVQYHPEGEQLVIYVRDWYSRRWVVLSVACVEPGRHPVERSDRGGADVSGLYYTPVTSGVQPFESREGWLEIETVDGKLQGRFELTAEPYDLSDVQPVELDADGNPLPAKPAGEHTEPVVVTGSFSGVEPLEQCTE